MLVIYTNGCLPVRLKKAAVKLFIAGINGHCLFKGPSGLLIAMPFEKSIS